MKKALITGITGQDGSYLAEFLLAKGYQVHGITRRASTFNTQRIEHLYVDPHNTQARLFLHYGDLSDAGRLNAIMHDVKPDEVYHLGAQSHVKVSFHMPEYTGDVTGLGTTRLLEAIHQADHPIKFYQASSSEMFGSAQAPQHELTPFQPRSPYAAAKTYAYWMTVNYRQAYGIFACNGILFNHESPRRGETFVTRKITRAVAAALAGKQKKLYLGNLNALRDWGFAPEYVEMMWLMLQHHEADDYVVGTGQSYTVRDFVQRAFAYAGLELEWTGAGVAERGIVSTIHNRWQTVIKPGDCLVEVDSRYFRPTEVEHLQADITKARERLCWQPRVTFDELVHIMVDYDLQFVGLEPIGHGLKINQDKHFEYTHHDLSFQQHVNENYL